MRYEVRTGDAMVVDFDRAIEAETWYDSRRAQVLDPDHWLHGAQLVRMGWKCTGAALEVEVFWGAWRWRPRLRIRHGFRFRWLCLFVRAGRRFGPRVEAVWRDHCAERASYPAPPLE